jgi:RNA polymerase sigma-70 factor (ECF subfamily)
VAAVSGGGDLPALMQLLAPDVTLWADGGGKGPGVGPRPIHGRDNVARLLSRQVGRSAQAAFDPRYRLVNGDPAILLFAGEAPFAVVVLDLTPDGEQVSGIYAVANPDKLARVH